MTDATKIAISLPNGLFQKIEQVRQKTGEKRSSLIQRALKEWLKQKHHTMLIRDYQEAYGKFPENDEEIAAAEQSAMHILSQEPWE